LGTLGGGVTSLWHGVPNPGGIFSNETGNLVFFGVSIKSTIAGHTFTANQVQFSGANYSLIGNGVNAGSLGAGPFNTPYFLGATTIGGALTPVVNGTTPYQEMYAVGFGVGSTVNFPGDYTNPATLQALMLDPGTPAGVLTGQYSLTGVADPVIGGFAGTDINGAPAPATITLMGIGLAGIVARVRRRKAA
jgi:hypothetical protein